MEDNQDNAKEQEWKARGYIVLASDQAHERIIAWIEQMPDCHLVFTKSAHHKRLMIKEEEW